MQLLEQKADTSVKFARENYLVFYSLRKPKSSQHGITTKTSYLNMEYFVKFISAKAELDPYKQFFKDTELEKARQNVFSFTVSILTVSVLVEKLDQVFKQLKYAAKINLEFRFALKNLKKRMFRCF